MSSLTTTCEPPALSPSPSAPSVHSTTAPSSPALVARDNFADTWHINNTSWPSSTALSALNPVSRSQVSRRSSTKTAGVRKQGASRHRSRSRRLAEHLRHGSSLNRIDDYLCYSDQALDQTCNALQWHIIHTSQQPSPLLADSDDSPDSSCQAWSVPTSPCSESGLHSLPTNAATYSQAAQESQLATAECGTDVPFDRTVASVEMR